MAFFLYLILIVAQKMNRLNFFLLFLAFLAMNTRAQNMSVQGTVHDSTGTQPVMNVTVMAVRIRDSLLLDFDRSDARGQFEIGGFPIDTFTLIFEHPYYDEKTYFMFGNEDNKDITISSVRMPSKSQEIEEVVIYAYKDPIYYKGDTLVYVADSFQVAEGAVVEDLLKKLPGIDVDKDGKITSQGQQIGKVLVDGDEFFGDDPTIATKNLGADGVDEVQVYEMENDQGIGGDDEKIQVLDLKLKDDAKKGYFGRISGASDFALTPVDGEIGTNPFYEGELLLNKFSGAQKISVFALGSNTPRTNFGWGDMKKFGLENETTSGNRWMPGATNNTSGIPQTITAGLYYSDKFGKKKQHKIGFNYSYYNNYLDARSASQSQYFLSDSSYVTDDSTRDVTRSESHRFNINFESKLDSLTTLVIRPSISMDFSEVTNEDISEFFNSDSERTLGTDIRNFNDSKGLTINSSVILRRKFKKRKRELEFRYDFDLDTNNTVGELDSRTTFFINGSGYTDTTLQSKLNDNFNLTHAAQIVYVEPLGKKFQLQFEYLYRYGLSRMNRRTYDFESATQDFTNFNAVLSNIFDNTRQQHRTGIELKYENSKHTIEGGMRFRNINIDNVNLITDTTISQNVNNFLPIFRYTFKQSMSKRFSLKYRTSSAQPSINDLVPVPDNTNPNRIREGNPDLLPNYMHNLDLGFNNWSTLSGQYVYAGIMGTLTDNAFSTSTEYDEFGRTVSKTVNVDGNMSLIMYSGAGLPFLGRKIELRPQISASYFRTISYIVGAENVTDNYAITPQLDVNFNLLPDSLEMGTKASYSLNNAISSLSEAASTPFSVQTYGAWFDWRLPKGFMIGMEGTYTKNAQPGDGFYDTEFFVMNAELSKRFLKTQNLEIALVGNDILNQNVNARREVQSNIITDYRTTIISRYFLLKMTLRFNNRKMKEDDYTGFH